jgi:hypothetical protein
LHFGTGLCHNQPLLSQKWRGSEPIGPVDDKLRSEGAVTVSAQAESAEGLTPNGLQNGANCRPAILGICMRDSSVPGRAGMSLMWPEDALPGCSRAPTP